MSKLWGGRFAAGTHPLMEIFGNSLASDSRLAPYDLRVCQAHVRMLGEVGAIEAGKAERLAAAIGALEKELADGKVAIAGAHEDVHSWVEAELKTRLGDDSSLIRLGRSRNDLVVTDFRLWMRDATAQAVAACRLLQTALLDQAEKHVETILPGYTHLQRAQPVSLGHHLLAHFWSLQRDVGRLQGCAQSADCCPLGAGALAGSSWPVQPARTAELLGFARAFDNSLDAVSDRDFAAEFLFAGSLTMLHLSRLCEELILWSTPEWGFVAFDDQWSTGSSLMPQKKNPDPAELVRGKSGRMLGYLTSLLTTMKSLPLAYNRDLQEDKPPVFEASDLLNISLEVMAGVVATLDFQVQAMEAACADPGLLATDLADLLVRAGEPFSRAHELSGKWVAGRLDGQEEKLIAPHLTHLNSRGVLQARSHPGAAGPESVRAQMARARALVAGR